METARWRGSFSAAWGTCSAQQPSCRDPGCPFERSTRRTKLFGSLEHLQSTAAFMQGPFESIRVFYKKKEAFRQPGGPAAHSSLRAGNRSVLHLECSTRRTSFRFVHRFVSFSYEITVFCPLLASNQQTMGNDICRSDIELSFLP